MKLAYVIDNSVSFQKIMEVQLGHLGYIVKSFCSAKEYLAQPLEKPNIILFDKTLNDTGDDLSCIREFQIRAPGVPIVLISANNDAVAVAEAMRQGVYKFIEKDGATLVRLRTVLDDIPLFILSQKRSARIRTGAWFVCMVVMTAMLHSLYQWFFN